MFQTQTPTPEVQAVERALKKHDGVEEALRLVEGLPDKDALELLIEGSKVHLNRTTTKILLFIFISSPILMLILFICKIFHLFVTHEILTIILLISSLPLALAFIFTQRSLHPRAMKNGEEAVARYATKVQQVDAVEILLDFSQKETTGEQTRLACWKALSRLLPRLSESQANLLPFESRIYLFDLVEQNKPRFPKLSTEEKIHVLLVLAARKDARTKRLVESQLVRPALRAVARSILEDWET